MLSVSISYSIALAFVHFLPYSMIFFTISVKKGENRFSMVNVIHLSFNHAFAYFVSYCKSLYFMEVHTDEFLHLHNLEFYITK